MAITEAYTLNAVTVGATELSILSGTTTLSTNTTPGFYQLFVDASSMAKADEFVIRVYEKVLSTGSKDVVFQQTLLGLQSHHFVLPGLPLLNGWDMTIQKIAGTDRAFSASVRKAG